MTRNDGMIADADMTLQSRSVLRIYTCVYVADRRLRFVTT